VFAQPRSSADPDDAAQFMLRLEERFLSRR
jgi:hypothetical protein